MRLSALLSAACLSSHLYQQTSELLDKCLIARAPGRMTSCSVTVYTDVWIIIMQTRVLYSAECHKHVKTAEMLQQKCNNGQTEHEQTHPKPLIQVKILILDTCCNSHLGIFLEIYGLYLQEANRSDKCGSEGSVRHSSIDGEVRQAALTSFSLMLRMQSS